MFSKGFCEGVKLKATFNTRRVFYKLKRKKHASFHLIDGRDEKGCSLRKLFSQHLTLNALHPFSFLFAFHLPCKKFTHVNDSTLEWKDMKMKVKFYFLLRHAVWCFTRCSYISLQTRHVSISRLCLGERAVLLLRREKHRFYADYSKYLVFVSVSNCEWLINLKELNTRFFAFCSVRFDQLQRNHSSGNSNKDMALVLHEYSISHYSLHFVLFCYCLPACWRFHQTQERDVSDENQLDDEKPSWKIISFTYEVLTNDVMEVSAMINW